MMSDFKASVQNELNGFFAHLANQTDLIREVSVQAFSKARQQFSHRVFSRLNRQLMQLVMQHLDVPLWNGLRMVAADGSKMRLFLKDITRRTVRDFVAFALYLPGFEMTLSFQLYSTRDTKRQMLFDHLDQCEADDLLVLDRGYSARWLIAYWVQHELPRNQSEKRRC